MKIAVTFDKGQIFQHFGQTKTFKFYETEGNSVVSSRIVEATDGGHSALAVLLAENGIEVLICGGIGGGAVNAMKELGIKLYGGASGSADEAVASLLKGTLSFDPNVRCSHHEEHHGGEEHHSCHGPDGCVHGAK